MATKSLDYPKCSALQLFGTEHAAVFQCEPVFLDFLVETALGQCKFPQPRSNDLTIGSDGLILTKYSCVQNSPFINIDGKVYISKNSTWEEVTPNSQTSHLHLFTRFYPKADTSVNFLQTAILKNPVPSFDLINELQNLLFSSDTPTTSHLVDLQSTDSILKELDFLYYLKRFLFFGGLILILSIGFG